MAARTETAPEYGGFFLACVKISLDSASLRYDGKSDRCEKESKIEKLLLLFDDGCHRNRPDNFVNAMISKSAFEKLRDDNPADNFGTWHQTPKTLLVNIASNIEMIYGDGYSRIQAAREYIPREQKENRWWVVNLINQGHDYRFSQSNRNNHSTANVPGVVVRHYLDLMSQNKITAAKQVQLGLTPHCRKDLRAIMRRKDLGDALIALVDISGLWVALKGAIHLMSLKGYDARSIYYLQHIRSVFDFIRKDGDRTIEVDTQDVKLLESRAPGQSPEDRDFVIKQMVDKVLFKSERDDQARERLLTRLLSITNMIPTLKTYSTDIIHLREIINVLNLLLDSKQQRAAGSRKEDIDMLKCIWKGPETSSAIVVEDRRDGEFAKLIMQSGELNTFEVQLYSLILHVMRNHTKLGNVAARTAPGKRKNGINEPTIADLNLFAASARTLGFHSDKIGVLSPDKVAQLTFKKALREIAPSENWKYDIESAVNMQYAAYQRIVKQRILPPFKLKNDASSHIRNRHGKPVTSLIDESASHLFFRQLVDDATIGESSITSVSIRMEFFRRFWKPVDPGTGVFWEACKGADAEDRVDFVDTPSMYSDDANTGEWKTGEGGIAALGRELQEAQDQNAHYASEIGRYSQQIELLREECEGKETYIQELEAINRRGEELPARSTSPTSEILLMYRESASLPEANSDVLLQSKSIPEESNSNVLRLEEKIRSLLKELKVAKLRRKEIKKNTELIIQTFIINEQTAKTSHGLDQLNEVLAEQRERLQRLQIERSKLEVRKMTLRGCLSRARYDLLGLRGVEALFYKRDPLTGVIVSQMPLRVPLVSGGLEAKFEKLEREGYLVIGSKGSKPYYLCSGNFQEVKSFIADPPALENITFFVQLPKRLSADGGDNGAGKSKRARLGKQRV
ncbi:hypothetical protein ACLOAV_008364 [Pseudogymnoascus australis]